MDTEDLWGDLELTHYPDWDPSSELKKQADILEIKSQSVVTVKLKTKQRKKPTLFPLPPEKDNPWQLDTSTLLALHRGFGGKGEPESPLSVTQEVIKELGHLGSESSITRIDFIIQLPTEDYSYDLLSIEHGIDFVPLVFRSESLRMYEVVDSPEQFRETLAAALQNPKTVALVKSLYNYAYKKANAPKENPRVGAQEQE